MGQQGVSFGFGIAKTATQMGYLQPKICLFVLVYFGLVYIVWFVLVCFGLFCFALFCLVLLLFALFCFVVPKKVKKAKFFCFGEPKGFQKLPEARKEQSFLLVTTN